MRELIVNADDFGLSSGVNRAVIKAWQEGVLTSASLMVGGDAFAEAVALAMENPGLQVGLHLTLVQGRSVAGRAGFPYLVDPDGYFAHDPVYAGMRYFFIKSLRRQLFAEIEAQITRFLETGLPLSHIDGHLTIHMHPTVFDILSILMPRYGIKTFRLSRERLGVDLRLAPHRRVGKFFDSFIFARLAQRCLPKLDLLGIGYAREVKGLLNSGRMTEEYFLNALDIVQEGVTEMYFHPCCGTDQVFSQWMPDYQHENELAALNSRRVMTRIRETGIVLRNYRGGVKQC